MLKLRKQKLISLDDIGQYLVVPLGSLRLDSQNRDVQAIQECVRNGLHELANLAADRHENDSPTR